MAARKIPEKHHPMRNVILVLLGILIVAGVVNHRAVRMLWHNMVRTEVPYSEDMGADIKELQKLSYSSVSASDTVNLYLNEEQEDEPLLILVHGGGFVSGDAAGRQCILMTHYFTQHGYSCASVDFRQAQEASFPAAIEDVKACIRFLRAHADEYGYDPDRFVLWGEASGGYLAVMAGLSNDEEFSSLSYAEETGDAADTTAEISSCVNVVVDFYGCLELGATAQEWHALGLPAFIPTIADTPFRSLVPDGFESALSWWAGSNAADRSAEEQKALDPYTYLSENKDRDHAPGLYISHGDCDISVPVTQSRDFYEAASEVLPQGKVTYLEVPGACHASDALYTDERLAALLEFLTQSLNE